MGLKSQVASRNTRLAPTPQPTLLFLHVPKTGGISLSTLLAERFSPQEVFHVVSRSGSSPTFGGQTGSCEDLRTLLTPQRRQLRCIVGHFHFAEALHESLERPTSYITLIRDPIDRIQSQLRSSIEWSARRDGGHQEPVDLPLPAFVRIASTITKLVFYAVAIIPIQSTRKPERAKENLRAHFGIVGTTERYEDFLRVLGGTLGWADVRSIRLNTSNNGHHRPLTLADRAWLIERNQADLELHQFATQLLDDQMAHLSKQGLLPEMGPIKNWRRTQARKAMPPGDFDLQR